MWRTISFLGLIGLLGLASACGEDAVDAFCLDGDGDGYGQGVDCAGPDCDDGDPACWQGDCCTALACGDFCDEFSIVLLPDTQYYTSKQADDANNTYYKQMQWILDHRQSEAIEFAIHLGDITNNNTLDQWAIADQAHAMLDAANMPYSVTSGNHDYLASGDYSRGDTHYADYFGPERFADKPWYGGSMDAANLNNYAFFEVGPYRFMVLSLEYAPRKDALCWADELIAAHPDRRVILATHCYLTHDGAYGANCPNADYNIPGSDGGSIWRELVSRHSNIFLVVSGHVGDSEFVPISGNNGNTVHQMLVDYQFEAYCAAAQPSACSNHCRAGTYTGNGWLRLLTFKPAENRITARTLSVEAGNAAIFPGGQPSFFCSELNTQGQVHYAQDPAAADHAFSFGYRLTEPVSHAREDLGSRSFNDRTVNSAGAGDQLAPALALTADGAFIAVWEDDSSSADGTGNHDIFLRGFAPGGCEAFGDRPAHDDGAGQQMTPDVAVDLQGNSVVVWADDADGNGVFQIRARGFAADGTARFSERTINSVATGQQLNPKVAMSPDGRFAVVWEDDAESDGTRQIFLRGFAADGSERYADRMVNDNSAGQHLAPDLAMDALGRVIVVWQDDSDGNGIFQIHGKAYAADGGAWLPRFTVNSEAAGQQRRPSVGVDAQGNFAVAWEDDADGDGLYEIMLRGFASDASERFADVVIHSQGESGHRLAPRLSMASDGRFTVVWEDDADGNGSYQVKTRGFAPDGSEWFSERTVNRDASGQQLAPAAGVNSAGALVYAWEDDMDGNGYTQILARGYDGAAL